MDAATKNKNMFFSFSLELKCIFKNMYSANQMRHKLYPVTCTTGQMCSHETDHCELRFHQVIHDNVTIIIFSNVIWADYNRFCISNDFLITDYDSES